MQLLVAPTSLQGQVGVLLDPALRDTINRTHGWALYTSAAQTQYPAVTRDHTNTPPLSTQDASILRENEYIACPKRDGVYLFLADGYVHFPPDDSSTRVGSYLADNPGKTLPVTALETALFRALLLQDTLLTHALVLRWRELGVLVLGDSGSGKTTLALAALAAGAQIVSDDRVALRMAGGQLRAHRMRDFLRIRRGTLLDMTRDALPEAVRAITTTAPAVELAMTTAPQQFISDTRIDTVVLLNRCPSTRPAESIVKPASSAETLAAAMASSLPYLFAVNTQHLGVDPVTLYGQMLAAKQAVHLTTGARLMARPVEEFSSVIEALGPRQ